MTFIKESVRSEDKSAFASTASCGIDYEELFDSNLHDLRKAGNYRTFARLERMPGAFPKALLHDGEKITPVTVWCSNDYLGMGQHPLVETALHAAAGQFGAGAGGTRNIAGTHDVHARLEQEISKLHGKDSALLFTSGYVANEAALSTLASRLPGAVLFSDEKNHASMIAGIRNSKADKRVFRHNDVAHLDELLASVDHTRPKIVACESVYSMDGSVAPLSDIVYAAKRHNALVYVDEVHAVGLYGPEGAGMAAAQGVSHQIDFIQGTLAKAYGVMGGYVAGSASGVDFIRSFASGFIFTTALSPVLANAALESLNHVRRTEDLRVRHQQKVLRLKIQLRAQGIIFKEGPSHIVPVIIGNAFTTREVARCLLENDQIYVQPIFAPTVPSGTERLRLTPTPAHTDEMIDELVYALGQALSHCADIQIGLNEGSDEVA